MNSHLVCYLMGVCVSLIVVFSGCRKEVAPDYASLGLAEVSGTILLDGKPLAEANVMFQSQDQTYSTGRTDAQGRYVLMFNSEKSGVLPGEKIVRIQLGKFPEDAENAPEISNNASELPPQFNLNSQLTATVVEGVQAVDFDLRSDGATASAAR